MRTGLGAALMLALACTLPLAASAETKRGGPETDERLSYCRGRMIDCLSKGETKCRDRYTREDDIGTCIQGSIAACNAAYGTKSDCSSREKISRRLDLYKAPGKHAPVN